MVEKSAEKNGNYHQKICCFGEALFRFSPFLQGEFIESAIMPVYLGGAELNVASALANFGAEAKYFTALPDNYLSKEIIQQIKNRNIDASSIKFCGERIGIYYLPQGADLKSNGVIYDRSHSSFSTLKPGNVDWETVLEDVNWFHFSAISPALSEQSAALCLEGLQEATKRNITISIDLNYRAKLWQYGKKPSEIMNPLLAYCHVIMGNIWSAAALLDIPLRDHYNYTGQDKQFFLREANVSAAEILNKFSTCHTVANTFRFDEGEGINYYASLNNCDGQVASSTYTAKNIIDRVGSGDCFMAGLIYGLRLGYSPQNIVEFATAAGFSKFQQIGDVTTSDIKNIEQLIKNNE